MKSAEQRMFRGIAHRLTSPTNVGLRGALLTATTEGSTAIDLRQEIATISRSIERVNALIYGTEAIGGDFAGINNVRRIVHQYDGQQGNMHRIFNPFVATTPHQPWLESLYRTIDVGNTEIGTTYRSPEKIKGGDPLSIFQWYLYDGVARLAAIHLGIPSNDEKQESETDWIACALTEATVVRAEEGDQTAQRVVRNMLEMDFIAGGWLLTDGLIERARRAIRG